MSENGLLNSVVIIYLVELKCRLTRNKVMSQISFRALWKHFWYSTNLKHKRIFFCICRFIIIILNMNIYLSMYVFLSMGTNYIQTKYYAQEKVVR